MDLLFVLVALTTSYRTHGTDDEVRECAHRVLAMLMDLPEGERPLQALGLARMAVATKRPIAFLKAVLQELHGQDLRGVR